MRSPALALALALALLGCVAPALTPASVPSPLDALVDAPFPQEHDHKDPKLHDLAQNVSMIGYHSLAPGSDGLLDASKRGAWMNSEIAVRGHYAFVGYLGAPWALAIVDLSDASAPKLVSTVSISNAWAMDVQASEDGNWVVLSVYPGAVGTLYARDYLLKTLAVPSGPAFPGVAIIDVRDKAKPALSSFFPIHGLGPHTAAYHKYPNGREVVIANKADAPGGNGALILDMVASPTGGRVLKPLAFWMLKGATDGNFPHDVDVQEHPVTGKTLLYAAYWDHGLAIVDITDPSKPTLVSETKAVTPGEEVQFHDVHPFGMIGDRHYTITAPEIPTGQTTGHLRVWDTTDPAKPTQVGEWTLPGRLIVNKPFQYSTHNFAFLPDGRIALAHGHAGVWILDWTSDPAHPHASGYYVPHQPGATLPAWAPVDGAPWVWGTAVDENGVLWAIDDETGLYSLRV